MSEANKLRFYIDQAIMRRDYASLAAFEGRLRTIEEPRSSEPADCGENKLLSAPPVWAPAEFTSH